MAWPATAASDCSVRVSSGGADCACGSAGRIGAHVKTIATAVARNLRVMLGRSSYCRLVTVGTVCKNTAVTHARAIAVLSVSRHGGRVTTGPLRSDASAALFVCDFRRCGDQLHVVFGGLSVGQRNGVLQANASLPSAFLGF